MLEWLLEGPQERKGCSTCVCATNEAKVLLEQVFSKLFVLAIAGDFPPCHSGVAAANVNKPLVSLVGRDATVDDV